MRSHWTRLALLAALGTTVGAPGLAAGRWKKVKPAGERKTLPAGKTLLRSASPDKKYVLLVRDEGEKGDFYWRSVYVQHEKSHTLLFTCNELKRPRWLRGPTRVGFEIEEAVGPDEFERRQVTYTPSTRTLMQRTIKTIKVEPSG